MLIKSLQEDKIAAIISKHDISFVSQIKMCETTLLGERWMYIQSESENENNLVIISLSPPSTNSAMSPRQWCILDFFWGGVLTIPFSPQILSALFIVAIAS